MNRNSIRWRLPASYAVIALVAALALGTVMLLVLRNYYARQEREYMAGNALALKPLLEQILHSDLPEQVLQDQINGLSFLSQSQIRLLDVDGKVVADSGVPVPEHFVAVSAGEPAAGMVMFSMPANPPQGQAPAVIYSFDQSATPQVAPFEQELIAGEYAGDIILPIRASPYGYGFAARAETNITRRSSQVVQVPLLASNGQMRAMLEFSRGPSYGTTIIESVTLAWLIASAFAVAVAALVGWGMSRQVTRPVMALEAATRRMEHGDLSVRVNLAEEKQQEFLSLANSFNGMADRVEQTVSTLRAFVADAAHELHTPLTALQANLELARDEQDASERSRYLSRVQEQGRRLEMLVNSLLDLSRLEAAESRSGFEAVDIVQLVREVSEPFASRAEQTGRSFSMSVPDETVEIQGSESQLRQVVGNLLENALKFTPGGGTISTAVARAEEEVTLTVTDTGIGIPPEDVPLLFKRFHRARNVSDYSGNGLGLAIVRAIVDLHHGTVVVRSEEKNGTTISIAFPTLPVSK